MPKKDRGTGDDVARAREAFAAAVNARLEELGVPPDKRAGWLMRAVGVRWQTGQEWLRGRSFPQGVNLAKTAQALGVEQSALVPEMTEPPDVGPIGWVAFYTTPEGRKISSEERWALRFFPWASEPTADDFRLLLAVYRANAARGK